MRKEDLVLVSVDDHLCEPPEMFDAHVPTRYRDVAPRVRTNDDGTEQWYYGDLPGRVMGLNAVAGRAPEFYNNNAHRYAEMRPGCYNVDERVRDMNAGGQLAGLNFPNWPGFGGQVLNEGPDPDLNELMISAYNDWHVDEWCGKYPKRFIPCGIIPYFDVERAANEVRRLAKKSCHAILFSENTEALGRPSVHSGYWDPLFKACSDEGTVICIHIGSSARMPPHMSDAPPAVGLTLTPVMSVTAFAELVFADFWWRFPDVKVCLSEGDIGWIPYFLYRAQHVQRRHFGWTKQYFPPGQDPKTLFQERMIGCFIEEDVGLELLDHFNVDNVCWEGDYPHSDGVWPNGPEAVERIMASLSDEVVDKITHQNAMRHFQFKPFAEEEREMYTVGALRAQALDVDTVTKIS